MQNSEIKDLAKQAIKDGDHWLLHAIIGTENAIAFQQVFVSTLLLKYNIDGVIATNTTLARDTVPQSHFRSEAGGLSGEPLRLQAIKTQQYLYRGLKGRVPIIGVGGIMKASDGRERINEGAELIQIYSGLIFKGYRLIHELCERTQQE